uniref:RNA-binding protein 45 n=1 Tax=Geotrypetes seraphini TaxID=260995 RepID=A0A6P8RDP8_GEOSA|nr:RNA-binding protein 45 [Geotrypetes seraphini]XP_033800748.1 RNA-binding protein 45 [Geotrypetes seraphini]XP_033800749.1 RNA-binding protein 45 [Geotrypetes seraphini]XP_033800750.1 RNA-binding protein 45 [Geotrypetes seraphini]XP_033800752.1 RNA-binding protein 45 [Geotrypetes seraphini]XP_033800753.1 RNA-binding protein 45 [Geotrypetes seraphini]
MRSIQRSLLVATVNMDDGSAFRPSVDNLDDPPNSRVFLVISKSITEEQIRDRFSTFGDIQDIWVVKDKHSKESKGIAFVKYAKSSQACRAMEEMHWTCLSENSKPIKVFIAQSRSSGSHRDVEDEELTRIFVMIPKPYTEEDLRQKFKVYGDIEYCSIIRNKATGESKGLGYVRYLKPSQAALAIENCDKCYKAILAEPKKAITSSENDYYSSLRSESMGHEHAAGTYLFDPAEFCGYEKTEFAGQETVSKRLAVVSCVPLIQEQLFSLFDLIPGLEYCEVQHEPYSNYGHAVIQYQNIASAVYAKYKLHGFEYPPGNHLGVSFVDDGSDRIDVLRKMATQVVAAQMASMVWNTPISQQYGAAAAAYERGGYSSHPPHSIQLQTDVTLPPYKKKAPADSSVKERLFLVFHPHPLPVDVLDDIFCRFGHLIEVYLVPGKNVGYAKFSDKTSAKDAMTALHGKVVNRVKLKVLPADSPRSESNKRQRTY